MKFPLLISSVTAVSRSRGTLNVFAKIQMITIATERIAIVNAIFLLVVALIAASITEVLTCVITRQFPVEIF